MARAATSGPVRGACPTVGEPMGTGDGLLVRVRLPGGRVTVAQLAVVAGVAASVGSPVELTSRGNLQLRGLGADEATGAEAALRDAGLVAPPPAHDGHRNVLAAPTAGFDPDELVDVGPLVERVARTLASQPALHPKLGVLLDGGGRVHLRERAHPLVLGAAPGADGRTWMQVGVEGPLGLEVPATATMVPVDRVVDVVELAAATIGQPERGVGAADELRDAVLGHPEAATAAAVGAAGRRVAPSCVPAGVGGAASSRWVGAAPLLGRLAAAQLHAVVELARRHRLTVRTTPWRSLLLAGVADADVAEVVAGIGAAGCEAAVEGATWRISACVGSAGCERGRRDVLRDGRRLVALLDEAVEVGGALHLAGCEKGCGAAGAPTAVVDEAGAYRVVVAP